MGGGVWGGDEQEFRPKPASHLELDEGLCGSSAEKREKEAHVKCTELPGSR